MSKRKRRNRSAVASFIRNVKAEIGHVEYGSQEVPLLYPPLKVPPKYPEFTIEQIDLVNYSRSFLAKALNSPFYQLFKQSVNPHILVEQVGKYADEFSKSLVAQRPNAFPDELKKKMKIEKDEEILGIIITDEKSSADEEEKENEKVSEEENQDEFAVKGLWEDGVESESLDSEEII